MTVALNERQLHAVKSIADIRTGASIDRRTANALMRKGYATIKGECWTGGGVTMSLTDNGRREAARIWTEEANRITASETRRAYAERVLNNLRGNR